MRRLIAAALVLTLGLTVCSDSDASTDEAAPLGDAPGVDGTDTDAPPSVFPLPPGDLSELFPYNVIDNDTVRSETATFLIAGPGVDAVITYYDDLLSAMGYLVADPVPLGQSLAIDIADPANPNISAVIQAGMVSTDDPTVQVNQELTELKE